MQQHRSCGTLTLRMMLPAGTQGISGTLYRGDLYACKRGMGQTLLRCYPVCTKLGGDRRSAGMHGQYLEEDLMARSPTPVQEQLCRWNTEH